MKTRNDNQGRTWTVLLMCTVSDVASSLGLSIVKTETFQGKEFADVKETKSKVLGKLKKAGYSQDKSLHGSAGSKWKGKTNSITVTETRGGFGKPKVSISVNNEGIIAMDICCR